VRLLVSLLVGALLVGLLAAAGLGFVLKSMPYHTPQLQPPAVRLTSADIESFEAYPPGVRAVPVLSWRDVSLRPGKLVMAPARFATMLSALRRDGFHSVRLGTLEALAQGRHVALPSRPVLLTFDAGLATDWTTVDPILQRYGFTAVVFVNPAYVALKSPSYFLTRAELQEMAASGRWDVGVQAPYERSLVGAKPTAQAGSSRGPDVLESVTEWRERAARDAHVARSQLEGITNRPVTAYAWPVLETKNPNTQQAPQVLYGTLHRVFPFVFGPPAAGTAEFVASGAGRRPLPRVRVTVADTLASLYTRLRTGIPAPPPLHPLTLPWIAAGGTCHTSNGRLILRGHRFVLCTVSADGSRWRDYQLKLRVTSPGRVTVVVQMRVSTAGRVEVAVSRTGIRVEEEVGGHWSVLRQFTSGLLAASGGAPPMLGQGPTPMTIRVAGRFLVVQVGGVTYIRQRISPALGRGIIALGIAATTRSHRIGFDRLQVSQVAQGGHPG
jgi:polysaccharide deacetylase